MLFRFSFQLVLPIAIHLKRLFSIYGNVQFSSLIQFIKSQSNLDHTNTGIPFVNTTKAVSKTPCRICNDLATFFSPSVYLFFPLSYQNTS